MRMRIRNIWLNGLSFGVGLLMVGYAVFSVVHYLRQDDGNLLEALFAAGVFALIAVAYFWISVRTGTVHKKRRALRMKSRRAGKTPDT